MSSRPFIPVSKPALIGREREYVLDCLDSTWISSSGKYIERFERKFADYLGVKHALSCCNGTVALHLALLALGIGPGDEVIVPTLTYVATANAVVYTGARPVLADAEGDTWNLDPAKIEALITSRTKAIIPVPLYGHPCDMDAIIAIARRYGLAVIEDAAEALGSKYRGRMCGAIADISTFSFYGNKTITTGEGGMVVTNDDGLAVRIRQLKGQGMDSERRYWFPIVGYNYRMTNVAAAIGLAQLENAAIFVEKRRMISSWYQDFLRRIPALILPTEKEYAFHSYWMYTVLIEAHGFASRDSVAAFLHEQGIETRPVFYPMHIMPVYKDAGRSLACSEKIAAVGLNLPTFYDLTEDDVSYIAAQLAKALGSPVF